MAFKADRYYHPYADFVAFLFGTGCRFGEAAALKCCILQMIFQLFGLGSLYLGVLERQPKQEKIGL